MEKRGASFLARVRPPKHISPPRALSLFGQLASALKADPQLGLLDPGTLRLALHTTGHDHETHLINASHTVHELWFGEPISRYSQQNMPATDQAELLAPTSHRLDGLPFISQASGRSHVHYLKVRHRPPNRGPCCCMHAL